MVAEGCGECADSGGDRAGECRIRFVRLGPAGRGAHQEFIIIEFMSEKIIAWLVQFITHVIDAGGYTGIAALMGIESACIPLPSEIIMPFAGYVAYLGHMNLYWAATAGAIGCNLGSVVGYYVGSLGGRPLVDRYGR